MLTALGDATNDLAICHAMRRGLTPPLLIHLTIGVVFIIQLQKII